MLIDLTGWLVVMDDASLADEDCNYVVGEIIGHTEAAAAAASGALILHVLVRSPSGRVDAHINITSLDLFRAEERHLADAYAAKMNRSQATEAM